MEKKLFVLLSFALLGVRLYAARAVGWGDSEALYASYALHPAPAYLDHPGLIGVFASVIGGGGAPPPNAAHVVTAILATALPFLVYLAARSEVDEEGQGRREDRSHHVRRVGRWGAAAADHARKDADEPRMIEVRRCRVKRVRRVERLAVAPTDGARGVEAHAEEGEGEQDEELLFQGRTLRGVAEPRLEHARDEPRRRALGAEEGLNLVACGEEWGALVQGSCERGSEAIGAHVALQQLGERLAAEEYVRQRDALRTQKRARSELREQAGAVDDDGHSARERGFERRRPRRADGRIERRQDGRRARMRIDVKHIDPVLLRERERARLRDGVEARRE